MAAAARGRRPLWQGRILANRDWLEEELTSLPAITDYLVEALVLSPQDVQFVHRGDGPDAARDDIACNRRFIDRLLQKGPHAYHAFMEALTEVGSRSIVEQLESTTTSPPDLHATGMTSEKSENDVPSYSGGPARPASGGAYPIQGGAVSVQNMYIKNLNQMTVGNEIIIREQSSDQQRGARRGTEKMCPESLLVALLKEILFHCRGKEDALYTLEQKLCSRLREEGKHVASFQEQVGIPFRQFLEYKSDDFDVTERGNEFIVSRVKDRRDGKPVAETSHRARGQAWIGELGPFRDEGCQKQTDMEAAQPMKEMTETYKEKTKSSTQTSEPMTETEAEKTESPRLTSTAERPQHAARSVSTFGKLTEGSKSRRPQKKQKPMFPSPAQEQPHFHTRADGSFILKCLAKKPGDDIIFRTSSDVYKTDPTQFCIDIVSLWNTPDREEAHIVLGIKPLVSLPHQVIGLRSGSNNAYYKKIFMASLFDFTPKFAYQEMMHEGKRVGVLKVEKSEGCTSPSIVKTDEKSPRLKKNQLWVRKEGKNVALEGSDMASDLVRKVHSWFLRQRGQNQETGSHLTPRSASGTKTAARHALGVGTELSGSSSSVDSLSADTEETSSPRKDVLTPRTTDQFQAAENVGNLRVSDVHSFRSAISEKTLSHTERPNDAPSASQSSKRHETSESSDLMKALSHFRKGHFVLLCGTLSKVVLNLHGLSNAPWIAVYDFDVSGRESGMLACLEDGLKKTRSVSVCTWKDPHTGITERGTQWCSLRGRLDVPESILSDLPPLKWLQKVCDKIDKLCDELSRFSQDYTVLSILVIWPEAKDEMKCMKKFLNKLLERVHVTPSLLLWYTDTNSEHEDSFEVRSIKEDWEDNVQSFRLGLGAFCSEIENVLGNTSDQVFLYQLPSQDNTSVDVSLEYASCLKQDFEVLYLKNPYNKEDLTSDALQREKDTFFRGGSISWMARYDMGAKCFDVERTLFKDIVNHIQKFFIREFRSGIIHLFHAPGSGGSTMAQRILFHFHEITPCVHLKQRSGSSTEEIAERLESLYRHTLMPVLTLLDGEDDQCLQQLRTQLRHNVIVFLSVKRYPHLIDKSRHCVERLGRFFLPGMVNEQESRHLVLEFGDCCKGDEQKLNALKLLDDDVRKKQMHQMFEYGLTVYDHEYRGVRAYVKGYLLIDQTEATGLKQWQKCLGYLSLVYYYAHASLPCHFIGNLLGQSTNPVLTIDDLPHEVRMLVVADTNEGRAQHVRIMHYAVATEILEQILNNSDQRSEDGRLSTGSKENLKNFCVDFLDQISELTTKSSQTVMNILTKTFIIRDMALMEMMDLDTDSEGKKKAPRFSQILSDLDTHFPYNDRLLVLQKLCDIYPDNANFKAHIGRFYSLCQPEKEKEAETCFKEAIHLAHESESHCKKTSDSRHQNESCVNLMFIHHMYACFFRRKTQRREQASVNHDFQANLDEMVADAYQSCLNFSLSRQFCPPGSQIAHRYLDEIDVRLFTCSYILHNVPGNTEVLLQLLQRFGTAHTFFRTSIVEIEDLIMECYNNVRLNDESLAELQKRVQKFNKLFRGIVEELQAVAEDDPLTSLRLKITSKKLQYDRPDNVLFVENPQMPSDVIAFVVETYQAIFNSKALHRDMVPAKLELDYQSWILAIRNPNFQQDHSLEEVLREVRRWCQIVSSPQTVSYFYLFTVLSLLGFGTEKTPGHEEYLAEAEKVKEKQMRRLSRTDPRARQQREWLGKDEGIRRLLSNSYVTKENHRLTGTAMGKLAVCRGTVLGTPRPAAGLINMDVHCKISKPPSVRVFFVPARIQDPIMLCKGSRVQFHLGFSPEQGYEAFEVEALRKFQCKSCGLWCEITKDQTSVFCKGKLNNGKQCGGQVFKT